MQFHRVHIEVTNICGLACSFCPPKLQPSKTMSLELFTKVLTQLQGYTKSLAFHVMGDPLILSNLNEYLELAHSHGFEVELTTSGYYFSNLEHSSIFHPCVRQLNISLNSYNKNSLKLTFDDYIDSVLSTCKYKLTDKPKPFINLRVWNFDEACSEAEFNTLLLNKLSAYFDIELSTAELYKTRPKSIRLASKVLLNFDDYFEWPSLDSNHSSNGRCYGLKSHIGILADGTVVPCCLDGDGVINLGNLNTTALSEVLGSPRAVAMSKGFSDAIAVEELCLKCSYKDRFTALG
ncbi:radical SAM/SPASM domain-containing protein [Sulfurimonas sp.]|uniref:radical SAM/SPASM domain-containing protein n=1 Tax=Sulfurimonas sp. TaxID=2022749 RepID=UPI00356A0FA5